MKTKKKKKKKKKSPPPPPTQNRKTLTQIHTQTQPHTTYRILELLVDLLDDSLGLFEFVVDLFLRGALVVHNSLHLLEDTRELALDGHDL